MDRPLRFKMYQLCAEDTAIYPDKGNNLVYTVLGLANEAGEVAGKLKKAIRDDNGTITPERKEQLKAELGDVLWYLAMCASELNLELEDIASDNLAKLSSRKERGTLQGDGDTR